MTGGWGTSGGPSNDLKFAREQGFFDTSRGVRWLIVVTFVLCLFLFLHFREVRVESLELNSVAERYIVAQVDFKFRDDEATAILRQEAVRDIGKIYKVSEKEIRQRRTEFENYLVYNQDWRKLAENSTFEEMYRGVRMLEQYLLKMRLTDPRTLQKVKEVNLPTEAYQVFTPTDSNLAVIFPGQMWGLVQGEAFGEESFQPGTIDFIIQYFKGRAWKLEEDESSQRNLRKIVKGRIPDRETPVNAGDRIIDQGERVTFRHVAMLAAMKAALSESRNLWHPETLLGSLILSILLITVGYAYFRVNYPQILESNRKIFLVVTLVALAFLLAKVTEYFVLRTSGNLAEFIRYPLVIPVVAILLCSLTTSGIAMVTSGFLTVVLTLTLAVDRHGFMLVNFCTAMVAILSTRSLRRRKEVFVVCGKAWLGCIGLIIAIQLYENTLWTGVSVFADILSTMGFMLLSAVLVVGLLPILESGFHVMTDVTLSEYLDPNHELLRRLSMEAPGTYQHSLVVGTLAEAAALRIGANGLFCRVAALYHDIGKITTPQYFTENQQGGMNMHQLLTPLESAQVIIAHVSEGVAMARRAGLPEQFIDIIKEHHGTTLVYYFYAKQLEQMGGDKSLVDEKDFRYMGPKPRTKESAILMIADSFEAASRSLEEINEESLRELVDRLVADKANDGQFDHCLLTFEELGIVKRSLVKTLVTAGHARIKYPHRESERVSKTTPSPPPESTLG